MVKLVIDLPPRDPQLPLPNYIFKLNSSKIRISNLNELLQIFHQKVVEIAKIKNKPILSTIEELFPSIHYPTFYDWIKGRITMPIWTIEKLILLMKEPHKSWIIDKIYKQALFSAGGVSYVKLPKYMNPRLSYLIGCWHGDGSLNKNLKNVQCTVEEESYLHNTVKPLFEDIFGVHTLIFPLKGKSAHRLVVCNMAIHSFLSLFCPIGKKINKLKIPAVIKKNRIFLKWYLSGLFDTDGSLPKNSKLTNLYFNFTQASKEFMLEVSEVLNFLEISHPKPTIMRSSHPDDRNKEIIEWRIQIRSKKWLNHLLTQIEFLHPNKRIRVERILQILNGPARNRTAFPTV